jgi:Tol biopolymer transport system component
MMSPHARSCSRFLALTITFGFAEPASAQGPHTGIFVMNLDGSDVRKIARSDNYRWMGSPSWSPDGERLAIDATPSGPRQEQGKILVMKADGTDIKDLGYGSVPRWSPDGKQVFFFHHSRSNVGEKSGVYVMNDDGTGRQWVCDGERARWSPDGSRIVHINDENEPAAVFVYDTVNDKRHRVAGPGYIQFTGATWSPDGERICLIGHKDNGEAELIVAPADKEDPPTRVRLRGRLGWHPDWSPDGKLIAHWILFDGKERIHLTEVDTDAEPKLLANQDGSWRHNTDPVFSPDGSKIAFVSDRPDSP